MASYLITLQRCKACLSTQSCMHNIKPDNQPCGCGATASWHPWMVRHRRPHCQSQVPHKSMGGGISSSTNTAYTTCCYPHTCAPHLSMHQFQSQLSVMPCCERPCPGLRSYSCPVRYIPCRTCNPELHTDIQQASRAHHPCLRHAPHCPW